MTVTRDGGTERAAKAAPNRVKEASRHMLLVFGNEGHWCNGESGDVGALPLFAGRGG